MNSFPNRLTSERYLANKEHFDSGLIALLEKQQHQIAKYKEKEYTYKATVALKNGTIRTLKLKLNHRNISIYNLNQKIKDVDEITEEYLKELRDDIQEIKKEVDKELQISYQDNAKLHDENTRLREEIEKLRRQQRRITKLDSTNSSKPPSSDGFLIRANMREHSDLKKGGQKGHKAHHSIMKANVTKIINKNVKKAPQGAEPIKDEVGKVVYYRTQEVNLLLTTAISETRYFINSQAEDLSKDEMKKYAINSVTYHSHFKSIAIYLNNKGDIALERLSAMLYEMSEGQVEVCASTIASWMKQFDEKSQARKQEILNKILKSDIIHVDETGWKINGKNAWMHTLTTKEQAYFVVTEKRKDVETGPLKLLEQYQGTLVHDHYKPYLSVECRHAECNAHILRYLKAGLEGYDDIHCAKMMNLLQNLNKKKKKYLEEGKQEMNKEELQEIEEEYMKIASEALSEYTTKNPKMPKKYIPDYIKTFKRMKEYKQEHLMFIRDFSVPFDNNAAERQMRMTKIKKKISGQSSSIETSNQFASVLTIMQSCNLQNKNTLKAIEDILLN